MKAVERLRAIQLRKEGFSYREILEKVSVSKSTLSLWLRDVGLAKHQKQRLTEKRRSAQKKAQEACRSQRIKRQETTIELAKNEVKNISERELWLIGVTLYWAEGSKQKDHNISQRVSFGNSDPKMILLFHKWLTEIIGLTSKDIIYNLYIHRTGDIERAEKFWSDLLKVQLSSIYFKNHNPKTNRKNTSEAYYGLMRLDIRNSTNLNRKIYGWVCGIVKSVVLE